MSDLPEHIQSHILYLLKNDKVFSASGLTLGHLTWTKAEPMFSELIQTIVSQQVSTAAAKSMVKRLRDKVGPLTLDNIKKQSDDELRECGMSRPKISYMRGLVTAIEDGTFLPESLYDLDDEGVIHHVTSLKGFGPWSAQMILMFTLARPDIWPAGDLGVRSGVQLYKKSAERPDIESTQKFGHKFKGYRTSAALLLWKLKDRI
ncbi:MAG: DNA-3-methyladenine glycosylase 2 family protein [Pseudomonadota bacterium]